MSIKWNSKAARNSRRFLLAIFSIKCVFALHLRTIIYSESEDALAVPVPYLAKPARRYIHGLPTVLLFFAAIVSAAFAVHFLHPLLSCREYLPLPIVPQSPIQSSSTPFLFSSFHADLINFFGIYSILPQFIDKLVIPFVNFHAILEISWKFCTSNQKRRNNKWIQKLIQKHMPSP